MRALRIITICTTFLVGGFALLVVIMNDLENGPSVSEDPTLLFPIAGFVLAIPSLIFNFKKLKSPPEVESSGNDVLDYELSNAKLSDSGSPKSSLFLWITNLIFGLYIFGMGLFLTSFVVNRDPTEIQADFFFPVFVTSVILFTGGSVIVLGRKR